MWRRVFFLYVLVSVLLNVWQVGLGSWAATADITGRSRLWATRDTDVAQYLLPGLRSKPNLLSTLGWWHGTWVGVVPFWRPLTSLLFWLEYHLMTPDRFDRWMLFSYACHLVFVGLLVVLIRRLTGRWGIAALAALLFAGSAWMSPPAWMFALQMRAGGASIASLSSTRFLASLVPCDVALDFWKNQPELWAGICTLAATLLALRGRWAGALALAVLGVCVKESGWYTFPIILLVLAQQRRLGTVPRWGWVATAASIVLLTLLRFSAGPAVFRGYHRGTNDNWWPRYSAVVEGPYLSLLSSPSAAAAILSGALLALAAWRRGPVIPRVLLGFGAFFLCAGLYGLTSGGGIAVGCVVLLDPHELLPTVLGSAIWLFVAWRLLARFAYRGLVARLVLMTLITAGSVAAASQVQAHVLYLTDAFQCCLGALGLSAVADDLGQAWTRQRKRLSPRRGVSMDAPNSVLGSE